MFGSKPFMIQTTNDSGAGYQSAHLSTVHQLRIRDQGVYSKERINRKNADDADGRGSSRIKPQKSSVNPLYQRHPRSINPYIDLKSALIERHTNSRAIRAEKINPTVAYLKIERMGLAALRMSASGIRPSQYRAKCRSCGPSERGKRIERVRSAPRSRQPV